MVEVVEVIFSQSFLIPSYSHVYFHSYSTK